MESINIKPKSKLFKWVGIITIVLILLVAIPLVAASVLTKGAANAVHQQLNQAKQGNMYAAYDFLTVDAKTETAFSQFQAVFSQYVDPSTKLVITYRQFTNDRVILEGKIISDTSNSGKEFRYVVMKEDDYWKIVSWEVFPAGTI